MAKKSLILYASMTGNTEKVALRFKQVFENKGWECDLFKVDKNTDIYNSPFDCNRYDFICAGSFVHKSLPSERLVDTIRWNKDNVHFTADQKVFDRAQLSDHDEKGLEERIAGGIKAQGIIPPPPGGPGRQNPPKVIFGPDAKKGLVFVTYAGEHQGPKEPIPALALLESELEHLKFQCVGRFACPGRFGNIQGWYEDLPQRPNEKDLTKAQLFLEEIRAEIEWVGSHK
jgi:hypothetical protein